MGFPSFIQNQSPDYISLTALDSKKDPVTGLSPLLIIRNDITGDFFNGTSFTPTPAYVLMIEMDSVNLPGTYLYVFTSPINNIRVKYYWNPLPSDSVSNGPFEGEAMIGDWVDDIVTTRKYVRNKTRCSNGTYDVFEDDKITIFESGIATSEDREPN